MNRPDNYRTRLDAWHLELGILADSLDYVLGGLDGPDGLAATAHVLKARLRDLLDTCPFPEVAEFVSDPDADGMEAYNNARMKGGQP
jgi:hypothetical protein